MKIYTAVVFPDATDHDVCNSIAHSYKNQCQARGQFESAYFGDEVHWSICEQTLEGNFNLYGVIKDAEGNPMHECYIYETDI